MASPAASRPSRDLIYRHVGVVEAQLRCLHTASEAAQAAITNKSKPPGAAGITFVRVQAVASPGSSSSSSSSEEPPRS